MNLGPGLIHTWLPTCSYVWTLDQPWYVELIWSNLNLNGDIQGWFWGIWVGFSVAALPALRVLVCSGIGSRQSRSDDNWCMPVVLGLLMGGDWFWCHLLFFGVAGAAFLWLAWVLWS